MRIKVNPLNTNSIDEAIKEVERQKAFIHEAANEIVQELTRMGEEMAKKLCPVRTGEAQASIVGYVLDKDCVGYIKATGEYVVFIEFGTGVVGQSSSHPSPEWLSKAKSLTGGKYTGYLSGEHIFRTADGKLGWIYYGDDGKYHFTEGMPSRPFMYETLMYLRDRVGIVAKEVLSGKG